MNNVVQKRTDLMNFFFNEKKTYTKEEILNKEFSVLSFSPTEEYIDTIKTKYDDLCVDLSTYNIVDTSEVFIKGIIVDVDRQGYQTIIHIQNKESVVSISTNGVTLQKYDDYLVVGEPVIVKAKGFNERLYLSLLIQLNNLDLFEKECNYLNGNSKAKIQTIMKGREKKHTHYGLIIECSMIKTKNGADMLIGTLYNGVENRSFGIVKNRYNPILPKYATAGDYVKFNKPSHDFFISNMEVIDL